MSYTGSHSPSPTPSDGGSVSSEWDRVSETSAWSVEEVDEEFDDFIQLAQNRLTGDDKDR